MKEETVLSLQQWGFFKSLLTFFLQNENEPLHAFCEKENMNQSTFCHFFVESRLQNLKENGIQDEEQTKKLLHAYFESKTKNRSSHTKNASKATRYLSENEELSIVQLCCLLGSMGYGITSDKLQSFISTITNWQIDECKIVEVSENIVCRLFSHHGKLLKLVQAASLDPKWVKQTSKETRDAVFAKLDSYIHLLKAMKLVS